MAGTVGAFIFPAVWQRWTIDEAARMLQSLQNFGVNTLATESLSYRDDLIGMAHDRGMTFVGGIACFSEHGANNLPLYIRPELWPVQEDGTRRPLMEWYIGVTPTFEDYNQSRLDVVEQIMRRHELDGLVLDFIRWPLHWELELLPGAPPAKQSSFDTHTVRRFLQFAGLELPAGTTTPARQARWILDQHREHWTDFKCFIIADFVRQARARIRQARPNATLGVYTVALPDDERAYWLGQRVRDLAPHVDYFAPMLYHPVLHQTPAWATRMMGEFARTAPGQVLPVLQVDSVEGAAAGADWGPPMPTDEWREVAGAALHNAELRGMVAFTGTALFADGRGEILAECVRESG